MNKIQIFKQYNKMEKNPEKYDNTLRNMYFLVISLNGWMDEYTEQYPDEFGL